MGVEACAPARDFHKGLSLYQYPCRQAAGETRVYISVAKCSKLKPHLAPYLVLISCQYLILKEEYKIRASVRRYSHS